MKIGIDISQTAFPGSGVARYTHALVRSLLDHPSQDERYTFFFSSLRKSPPQELVDAIKAPHQLIRAYIPPSLLSYIWNDLHVLPVEKLIGKHDIYVSSDWTQPPVKHARSATIIHDMIPFEYPETSTTSTRFLPTSLTIQPNIVGTHTKRLAWVAQECPCIIADSHSTKKDIMKHLAIPDKNIHVVYPAVTVKPISASKQAQVRKAYGLHRPFILTVGKIEPRKNISALIQAFAQSTLAPSHDLAIVGARGWGDASTIPEIPAHVEKSLRWLGYVPDEDLYALYGQAQQSVMPSLYEGFGFPIIEAMALGCPVACSDTSSLGELGKGYAQLFNPLDINDITQALEHLHRSVIAGKYDHKKAQKYAQSFTTERFGREFLSALTTGVY